MDGRPPTTRAALVEITNEVREKDLSFVAGSLAYNAFASLVPLLLLLFLVAGSIGGESIAARMTELTSGYLTPNAQGLVAEALDGAEARTGLSVVGGVVLLWGTLKVFRGLNTAFGVVYETRGSRSLLAQLRNALAALVAIGLAIGAVSVAGAAFAVVQLPLLHLLNPILLLLGLTVAFLPLYYVLPAVDMSLREAFPGAFVAAGGWAILEVIFQIYAANVGKYAAYGVLGAILLLVTWLYFSGFVLLVGAAVNYVLAGRSGPDPDSPFAPEEPDASADGNARPREPASTVVVDGPGAPRPGESETADRTGTAAGEPSHAGTRRSNDDADTDADADARRSGRRWEREPGGDATTRTTGLARRVAVSVLGVCVLVFGVALGRLSK